MISNKELWACAHAVMEFHGERVDDYLLERMRAMAAANDQAGLGTWLAITDRVRVLSSEPREGQALH